jgi:acetate kinase
VSDAILVLNAGSSSIKFSLFAFSGTVESLVFLLGGQLQGLQSTPQFKAKDAAGKILAEKQWLEGNPLGHDGAIAYINTFLQQQAAQYALKAVGHRIVHGGAEFFAPIKMSHAVLDKLDDLIPLAPLHQPHNLKLVALLLDSQPNLPQVACFDTAFHHTQADVARAYALPPAITEKGVYRYGFHGLSYEYIASVLPQLAPDIAEKKVIVLHMGNGVSLCALQAGKSVATTMGFSALDGVPMSSRCGSLDPGVVLYLLDELKLSAKELADLLYKKSGLLGVSGVSSDMRELLESDVPAAQFAVDLFVYRVAREIGSLAAALGGVDALVFTAGIGEHSAIIREKICAACAWLGVEINATANAEHALCISKAQSRASVWVIPTNEELMIAQHTAQCCLSDV